MASSGTSAFAKLASGDKAKRTKRGKPYVRKGLGADNPQKPGEAITDPKVVASLNATLTEGAKREIAELSELRARQAASLDRGRASGVSESRLRPVIQQIERIDATLSALRSGKRYADNPQPA